MIRLTYIRRASRLSLLAGLGMLLLMPIIFIYAPQENNQGVVQKIFYFHLGFVAAMYGALFLGMLFAASYLLAKKSWCAQLSFACNEVAFVFISGVLLSGMIWAKPIWGSWWTWDARLTTTLLIWLIYAIYLLVQYSDLAVAKRHKIAAFIAIIGFLDVPLIHYSVQLFRAVHPQVIKHAGLPPAMAATAIIAVATLMLLAASLIEMRYTLVKKEESRG